MESPNFPLEVLERFEKQIQALVDRKTLIPLFCKQIIPFLQTHPSLENLRIKWRKKYEELVHCYISTQEEAFAEVKEVLFQIERSVKSQDDDIKKKILTIKKILSGDSAEGFTFQPFYFRFYCEVKGLLQILLEQGHLETCRKYAVLRKTTKSFLTENGSLELKEEYVIDRHTFAPAVEKANSAREAMSWKRAQDPIIAWHYFELAAGYWTTDDSYFEKDSDLLRRKDYNPLPVLSEKTTWWEIVSVKKQSNQDIHPIIFTGSFFKEGFCTLFNEITMVASRGFDVNLESLPVDQVTLELHMQENLLWIFVYNGLSSEPQQYYLKRFNDGASLKSGPYGFIKNLLENHSNGNMVSVDLIDKTESIPKHIDRIGLKNPLKDLFFGRSRGNKVSFKGCRVAIDRDEKCRNVLSFLEETHQNAGSPKYM